MLKLYLHFDNFDLSKPLNSPTKQIMKSHKDWLNRFLWIILFSVVIWGCSGNRQTYLGKHYVNKNRYQFWDFIFYKKYVVNTELELHADSTYHYETCAVKSYGKWKTDGIKVYLMRDTTYYKIGSFNHIPEYVNHLKHKENVDTFIVRKKKLIRILRNLQTIERLKKWNDLNRPSGWFFITKNDLHNAPAGEPESLRRRSRADVGLRRLAGVCRETPQNTFTSAG